MDDHTVRRLIMVRYGEIYLKGQNRPFFLKLLIRRVRNAVKPFHASVLLSDSRLIVAARPIFTPAWNGYGCLVFIHLVLL